MSELNDNAAYGANVGFVFVKPHANSKAGREAASSLLKEKGVEVICEGSLSAEAIDKEGIIDQHYKSLACKAMELRPDQLVVQPEAAECFEATFGLRWADALKSGRVCNARQALERLGLDEEQLDDEWTPLRLNEGKVKFGGGFYCGKIRDLFVVNGFYMAMRRAYTLPGRSVQWYVVRWQADDIPWEEFRRSVLGATHPEDAEASSLRGYFRDHWKELGLKSPLHAGDNAVHASAGAFEAMVERANWLGIGLKDDPFGRKLVARGVSEATLKTWASDPIVSFQGRESSLFDLFENLDGHRCVEKADELCSDTA
jgi:hypothetical protein